MSARRLARTAAAYTAAGLTTAITAFAASIPYTQPIAIAAVTACAALLVGWPVLRATDNLTRHRNTQGDRT